MERVLVIGCPGSGKSTFARRLRDLTGLPLYYLDRLWHRPDGTHVPESVFDAQLETMLREDAWIIDGNYLRTLEVRLRACDTVFFLDYPVSACLVGAAARIGRPREDMPWVETAFDPEFRDWICAFPQEQKPQMETLLARYAAGRHIVRFGTRQQADAYLLYLTQKESTKMEFKD